MERPSLVFGGTIPRNYEDFLGPFLFEPYAADITERIDFSKSHAILELACGSGRVTRFLSNSLPASASLIASDLNAEMLKVAKMQLKSSNITWAVIDMTAIPYPDSTFDLVVCQFGIMLVPDQKKALSEIFRVLKPGGKLIFSTWAALDDNRIWAICDKVLAAIFEHNPLPLNPGPFAMQDEQAVLKLLSKTGFSDSSANSVEKIGEINTAAQAANGFISGLPLYTFIKEKAADRIPEILKTFEIELIQELGDNPMRSPQRAWVFEATK